MLLISFSDCLLLVDRSKMDFGILVAIIFKSVSLKKNAILRSYNSYANYLLQNMNFSGNFISLALWESATGIG